MARSHGRRKKSLAERFPPSAPCACPVCAGYCARPGWWSVAEAVRVIQAGYGQRMMLEVAPEGTFGVLSPAFRGCEGGFARNALAARGCNFHQEEGCQLFGTGLQPLECRFCHHERPGQGPLCHAALEEDWNTPAGRALVIRWCKRSGLWARLKAYHLNWQV